MGTFFTWTSIVGIAAGVMILCVVLSIMNGFDENIETKLVQINGKIKILSQNPIRNYKDLMQRLRSQPHVLGVSPFVQGIALVQKDGRVIFPKCFGFDKKAYPVCHRNGRVLWIYLQGGQPGAYPEGRDRTSLPRGY